MIALMKGKMMPEKEEGIERGRKKGREEREYRSCKWRRMNGASEETEKKKNVSQGVRMYKPEQIVITSL